MSNRAVLSIDFEPFASTPAYRRAAGTLDDPTVGLESSGFLRDLLATTNATATFFVVSAVAESHPTPIERFANAGHEIASHTHTHALLSDLDESAREEEFERSRSVLEDVTGQRVSGFRSPAFDLPDDHFERLHAAGYTYDSSVVPCRSIPGWYGGKYDVERPCPATRVEPNASEGIVEVPVGTMPGVRLPLTGTWLRFFGPRYTILGMKLLARRGITPVLYVHPWELVDLPPVEDVPKRVYWHTGAWMRRALARILNAPFEFVTARTVVEDASETNENDRIGEPTTDTDDTPVSRQS